MTLEGALCKGCGTAPMGEGVVVVRSIPLSVEPEAGTERRMLEGHARLFGAMDGGG